MPEQAPDSGHERPLCYIDGQVINIDSMSTAVAASVDRMRSGSGFTFFTLNLDHLAKRRDHDDFRRSYDRATFVSADGAPIVWLSRAIGADVERTTGADMVGPIAAECARNGIKVFLFGSSEAVLEATAARLTADFPGVVIAGMEAPPMGFDPLSPAAEASADRIAQSGAGICFVALGAPKQEIFADMALARHPHLGLFCIGAALDFIAGTQRRAPAFMANNGLEWLWRLSQDPRRMVKRYVKSALILAWLAMPWQLERLVNAARVSHLSPPMPPARAPSPPSQSAAPPPSGPTALVEVPQPSVASCHQPDQRF